MLLIVVKGLLTANCQNRINNKVAKNFMHLFCPTVLRARDKSVYISGCFINSWKETITVFDLELRLLTGWKRVHVTIKWTLSVCALWPLFLLCSSAFPFGLFACLLAGLVGLSLICKHTVNAICATHCTPKHTKKRPSVSLIIIILSHHYDRNLCQKIIAT